MRFPVMAPSLMGSVCSFGEWVVYGVSWYPSMMPRALCDILALSVMDLHITIKIIILFLELTVYYANKLITQINSYCVP